MSDQLGGGTAAFANRLMSEVARCEGGLPTACAEIGVAPSDIEAIRNGETTSESALIAIYNWLDSRADLSAEEREQYTRLRVAATRRSVAVPAGGSPAAGPARRGALTVGGGAVALTAVIIIVVLTVLLTTAIMHPAGGGTGVEPNAATTASASASPSSATKTAEPSPSASDSASPAPPASPADSQNADGPTGNLIANYSNYNLPCDDGITIGPGGAPAPQPNFGGDLSTECDGTWYAGDQDNLGLLSGKGTYSACSQDTVISSQVSSITSGDVLCFQGTGTIAVITIAGTGESGGIDYTTLNVRVWRTGAPG